MKKKLIFNLAALGWLLAIASGAGANTYYVSKNGNNSSGTSWTNAWNEMNQVNWSAFSPGDTLYLDGGTAQMVYTTPLTVGASGTSTAPIQILLSKENGHHGQAVIAGRSIFPMPYDNQAPSVHDYSTDMPAFNSGLVIGAVSWIVVDGTKWRGLSIHGAGHDGIMLGAHSADPTQEANHITLRNIEIYDIGTPQLVDSTVQATFPTLTIGNWHTMPNATGIFFSYQVGASNVFMERMIIANTSDEGIGEGPCRGFTMRACWENNDRVCADGTTTFNYLNHPDGLQNYNWGGMQGPYLIEDCIIGPHFMQGLFPGVDGSTAVNNITVRNVLFFDNLSSNIYCENNTGSPWVFDHITSYVSPAGGNIINLSNTDNTFNNSIFYGGYFYHHGNDPFVFTNNVYYHVGVWDPASISNTTNAKADPLFVFISSNSVTANFALQAGSPAVGKGSRITSVAKLFELYPDAGPGFFQLSVEHVSASETAGTVSLAVNRWGGSAGGVSVHYATSNGSALSGTHYTAAAGDLNWSDGDASDKLIPIPVFATGITSPKAFYITLSNPAGGAILETPSVADITLTQPGITPAVTPVGSPTGPALTATQSFLIYPNPAHGIVHFLFSLDEPSRVTLEIYNVAGKRISKLDRTLAASPTAQIDWECPLLAAGVYFCKPTLAKNNGTSTRLPAVKFAVR